MFIINYVFVAILDGSPIAAAHTKADIEEMLDEYNGVKTGHAEKVKYEPYNSKYPSINDLEGVYTYKDKDGEYEIKVYGTEYKREKAYKDTK